ncbi:MAG: hypothetical protein HOD60_08895 [Candidatus Nitrosopelagicus sp.]|jgi:hypothetical protein|nr:hypothetical protein [Candidatus Nitrosopelagicus sp.]
MKLSKYKYHILLVIPIVIILLGGIFVFPMIDEFPADGFACITQPCVMPQITIFEWITRLF